MRTVHVNWCASASGRCVSLLWQSCIPYLGTEIAWPGRSTVHQLGCLFTGQAGRQNSGNTPSTDCCCRRQCKVIRVMPCSASGQRGDVFHHVSGCQDALLCGCRGIAFLLYIMLPKFKWRLMTTHPPRRCWPEDERCGVFAIIPGNEVKYTPRSESRSVPAPFAAER